MTPNPDRFDPVSHEEFTADMEQTDKGQWVRATMALKLAEDLLSLADDAGMPDSYKATDSRVQRARLVVDQFGS